MILRNSLLRHGRQAVAAQSRPSCLRALATDRRPPLPTDRRPPLPTAFADPMPAPDQSTATFNEAATALEALEAASVQRTPQPESSSSTAIWSRQRRTRVDKRIADKFRRQERFDEKIGRLGSVVERRFNPSALLQSPPRPEDVTLELLMAAQCHMGHHSSLWNPANQRYIYGVRSGIHIISLEEVAASLRRAAKVVEEVAYLGGLILFVGNRKGQMEITARAAELAGACHLFTKWIPGTITNRDQILGKEQIKVVDEKDQVLPGFEKHLLERRPLMPELVVVLNPLENYTLLQECAQENIPTIGLIDTDADPTRVTYTIPGNDDSLRSVGVIAGVLGRAGEAGQKRRLADGAKGICTWRNSVEIEAWNAASRSKERAESTEAKPAEARGIEGDDADISGLMEQVKL